MKDLPVIHNAAGHLPTHLPIAFGHKPDLHFEHIDVVFLRCQEGLERVFVLLLLEDRLGLALVVGCDEGGFLFLFGRFSILLLHRVEQIHYLL